MCSNHNHTSLYSNAGLPVQVRDKSLGLKDEMPKSDVNKEYYTQNVENQVNTLLKDLQID
jgi:hypothetical protein